MHLVDSHLCADASKFLAALLLSLTTMLHLGLPHVNVLSKLDLIASAGAPAFSLEFYTQGGDMRYLADAIAEQPQLARYAKLTRGLCDIVADYALVSFATLDVQDEASMRSLLVLVDRCNGAVFASEERAAASRGERTMPPLYAAAPPEWDTERTMRVEERYFGGEEE